MKNNSNLLVPTFLCTSSSIKFSDFKKALSIYLSLIYFQRKLRTVQKTEESYRNQKSLDEKQVAEDEFQVDLALQKPLSCSEDETGIGTRDTHTVLTRNNSSPVAEQVIESNAEGSIPEADSDRAHSEDSTRIQDQVDGLPALGSQSSTEGLLESDNQQFIEDNAGKGLLLSVCYCSFKILWLMT